MDQLASYYGLDPAYAAGDQGAGVTVGVIEFARFEPSDLATFEQCYGRVAPQVTTVPVDGGPGAGSKPESAVESELDLELIAGLAPAANVVVYEGELTSAAAYDAFSTAVAADAAQVLSTSWGACEAVLGLAAVQAEGTLFERAALQGETVVAAAGDSGSEDCYGSLAGAAGDALQVDDPASQPYVTGVGGTTLVLSGPVAGGPGTTGSEIAWNTGIHAANPGAGGGGVSSIWPMPAYQADAPGTLGVVGSSAACPSIATTSGTNGDCREVPDVSADAGDPIAIYCTIDRPKLCTAGGWTPLDGTSAAAPIWAALFALADASPACAATGALGFANPALYAIAGGSGYSAAFHDVTSGDNDLTRTNHGRYAAAAGYDLATGLGTPIAGSGTDGGLIAGLCSAGPRAADQAGLPPPLVDRLIPASARSRGGAHIVIAGSGFSSATRVSFGSRRATGFRVLSATRIVAVVPSGNNAVHVTVSSGPRTSARTGADLFRYVSPPVVLSVKPAGGPRRGDALVTILGRDFRGVLAVRFGTALGTGVVVRSPSKLLVTSPSGSGTVSVQVVTTGGTSPPAAAARYRYAPA